jgi:hypothetical protein
VNHIHRLQNQLDAARAELRAKGEILRAFQVHLMSEKFQGYETDGQRKDWIATADARAWIQSVIDAETPSESQEASVGASTS